MPRATFCLLTSKQVSVEEAIELRDGKKQRKVPRLDFRCIECREPVRPHNASTQMAAHFEHLKRNPSCRLSDPLR